MRSASIALLTASVFLLAPVSSAQKEAAPMEAWYSVILPDGAEMVRARSLRIESGGGAHQVTAGRRTLKTTGDINILLVGLARGERAPDARAVAACAGSLPLALKMGPPPQQAQRGTTSTTTVSTTLSEDGKTTTTTTSTSTTSGGSTTTSETTTTSPADPLGECPTSN